MACTKRKYRCYVSKFLEDEFPDCYNCHVMACLYHQGYVDEPYVETLDVTYDDEGNEIERKVVTENN